MKKCLYCAEEIQDEAIVCRYCGKKQIKNKKRNYPKLLGLGIALLLIPYRFSISGSVLDAVFGGIFSGFLWYLIFFLLGKLISWTMKQKMNYLIIAVVTIAAIGGVIYLLTQSIQPRFPQVATPMAIVSTSILPTGYEYYSEPMLGIRLAIPKGWARNTGQEQGINGFNVPFTVFYFQGERSIYMLNIFKFPTSAIGNEKKFVEDSIGLKSDKLVQQDYKVISTNTNFLVDGKSSYYHAYKVTDPKGNKLYSVIIVTSNGLFLQFVCSQELQYELDSLITPVVSSITFQ